MRTRLRDRASLPRMGELLCVCDRSWLLCRRSNCFARAIGCGFISTDGRAAPLARSIMGLLPRIGCTILMIACGFEVCVRNPRTIADPRFAQQNPRMVRIRTLRLTYIIIIYITLLYY